MADDKVLAMANDAERAWQEVEVLLREAVAGNKESTVELTAALTTGLGAARDMAHRLVVLAGELEEAQHTIKQRVQGNANLTATIAALRDQMAVKQVSSRFSSLGEALESMALWAVLWLSLLWAPWWWVAVAFTLQASYSVRTYWRKRKGAR